MAGINENLIRLSENVTRLSEQVVETRKGISELKLAMFGVEGATGVIKALHDLGNMLTTLQESNKVLQLSHNECMGKRKALESKMTGLEEFKSSHLLENENLKSWSQNCEEKIKTLEHDNSILKEFKNKHDNEELVNKKTWHMILWIAGKSGLTLGGVVAIVIYFHDHWDKFKLFMDTFLKSK